MSNFSKRRRIGRPSIYLEPHDLWIGVYVAPAAVYVCPLPMLVLRWSRPSRPMTRRNGPAVAPALPSGATATRPHLREEANPC